MSVEAITWALRQQLPNSSTKFVLVVLANCASAATGVAWPSIKYLSDATMQNRKTIIANLQRLVAAGLIEDVGDRVGHTNQIVVYRLALPAEITDAYPPANRPKNGTVRTVPLSAGKSTEIDLKQSRNRDTEPLEPSLEPKQGAVAPLVMPEWLPAELWQDWHNFRNAKAGWTAKARELSLGTLTRLREQGQDPRKVIEQSIERGWTGLFDVRAPDTFGAKPSTRPAYSFVKPGTESPEQKARATREANEALARTMREAGYAE
jgi:hypothetical protein